MERDSCGSDDQAEDLADCWAVEARGMTHDQAMMLTSLVRERFSDAQVGPVNARSCLTWNMDRATVLMVSHALARHAAEGHDVGDLLSQADRWLESALEGE